MTTPVASSARIPIVRPCLVPAVILCTLLLIPGLLNAAGDTGRVEIAVSRDEAISASVENVPISQILGTIAQNIGLELRGSIPQEQISVNFSNLSLPEALKRLLLGYNYVLVTSEQSGKAVLMVMGRAERSPAAVASPSPEPPVDTQVPVRARGRRVFQGPEASGPPPEVSAIPGQPGGPPVPPAPVPPGMEPQRRLAAPPVAPGVSGPGMETTGPEAGKEQGGERPGLRPDGQGVAAQGAPALPDGTATGPAEPGGVPGLPALPEGVTAPPEGSPPAPWSRSRPFGPMPQGPTSSPPQ